MGFATQTSQAVDHQAVGAPCFGCLRADMEGAVEARGGKARCQQKIRPQALPAHPQSGVDWQAAVNPAAGVGQYRLAPAVIAVAGRAAAAAKSPALAAFKGGAAGLLNKGGQCPALTGQSGVMVPLLQTGQQQARQQGDQKNGDQGLHQGKALLVDHGSAP